MYTLKKLLNLPIKKTLILLLIALIVFVVFMYVSLVSGRYATEGFYLDNQNLIAGFIWRVANDFTLLSRIVLELTTVVLVSQIIYRLAHKKS